ncbi:hypothetical protein GCM10009574_021980 [Streptomyces asiaticus]|uniref:MvdD-like pre-ATP grasp domain-containing protein n=1 Tax=Streptomyces rhizosphaericus TaxID=114699 RepID=A0ABP4BEQ9_9ACTN
MIDAPVMVVTNLDDPTTDLVIEELHGRGISVVRFDSGDFPATLSVAATITRTGIAGTLTTPSRTADLTRVRSLYYRRPSGSPFRIWTSRRPASPSLRPDTDWAAYWPPCPAASTSTIRTASETRSSSQPGSLPLSRRASVSRLR